VSAVSRFFHVALACTILANIALGQGNPWFGEDALVLSRGMVRLGFAPTWTRFDQRYRADGDAEPLAIDLSIDTLGVSRFSTLAPLERNLRGLTGDSDLRISLGRTRADQDVSVLTVPFSAELGIGTRLSLGVMVPIVRTRSQVWFSPNGALNEGNVGINPALDSQSDRAQNAELLRQFGSAIGALASLIEDCADPSNPDPRCPQARTPEAEAFLSEAEEFASGLGETYSTLSPFVAIEGSAIDSVIRARIASLGESFAAFDINDITSSGPAGATIAGFEDFTRILTDSTFGLQAQPFSTRTRTNVGDIEVGAKFQLLNTVRRDTLGRYGGGVRVALAGIFRAGTGRADDPDDFADIPTGDGQHDVEARTYWDLLFGRHFALGILGRYTVQLPDREIARIAEPHQIFVPYWRRQEVERDLGDIIDAEITPRIAFGDFFSFMAQYRVRRKAEDRHTGRFNTTDDLGEPVTLDASVLDLETEQREDRVTIGLGYSTLASAARRRSRIPLEIIIQYGESIRGSGGRTPKVSVGVMNVRVWF
jgi:hypothetical protein